MHGFKTKRDPNFVEKKKHPLGPRPDFIQVHKPRDLGKMLKKELVRCYGTGAVSDCSDELIHVILQTAQHWLMDEQHADKMARDLKAQQVINRLKDSLLKSLQRTQ